MIRYLIAFSLMAFSLTALSLTDAWSVNVNDHAAVQRVYKRGESIDIRITLRDGLRPLDLTGATARWYWYTNAVDNLWWTNSAAIPTPKAGLVSAAWTPSMDTGAALYPYWVGLWMPGATSPLWRVNGTIRLLGSPGLTPNSQPVPVRTLDFGAITVTNAPWVTAADWTGGSNALANALLHALTNTVPAQIAAAVSAIPPYVETDADALSALAAYAASNKVSVIWESSNIWWTVGESNVLTRRETLIAANTNVIILTFSSDFREGQYGTSAPQTAYTNSYGSYFQDGNWEFFMPSVAGNAWSIAHTAEGESSAWTCLGTGVPATLTVQSGSFGSGEAYAAYLTERVTNRIDYALTTGDVWQAVSTSQATADEALFAADGASGAINNHVSAGNAHASLFAAKLSQAQGDARYLSSTPGWFLQGSQVISTNSWTTNLTGYAATTNGMIALVPYTTSRHDVTGSVTVVAQRYIVGVSAAWSMALSSDPTMPRTPMGYRAFERVSPTSFTASAWCSTKPSDANPYYWGYVSNIIVQTYDRAEMSPGTYTNDAAGIVSRVDSLPTASGVPVTGNGHARAAVNAESMPLYVDSRKTEFADAAWDRTPGGKDTPDSRILTIDEPMVQQGSSSYMWSGDHWIFSYDGGDWFSSTTGSVWRLGPSGRTAFEITATNRMLHIQGFVVEGGYATIDISTNWVLGTPSVEFCGDLSNQQWLSCPAQTMTDNGSYWRATCPATVSNRYFRAVDPTGNNVLKSHFTHEFLDGIRIGTNTFHDLSELKAQLEALP